VPDGNGAARACRRGSLAWRSPRSACSRSWSFWPGTLPRADDIVIDWRVLAFAVAASLASSLVFGLAPALRVPARQLDRVLHGAGRAIRGGSRRLHVAFVAVEIALAIVLLVCAGALGRTLLRLTTLDPGVDVHNVLVARTACLRRFSPIRQRTRAPGTACSPAARTVPGVEAVAAVDTGSAARRQQSERLLDVRRLLPPLQRGRWRSRRASRPTTPRGGTARALRPASSAITIAPAAKPAICRRRTLAQGRVRTAERRRPSAVGP
jgi:hypothetical protein